MSTITRLAVPAVLTTLLVAAAARAEEKTGFIGVQIKADPAAKGLLVTGVTGESPAEKGGLKADDVITKIDGKEVGEVPTFVKAIKDHKPGDKITLTVLRDGKEKDVKITVGEAPADKR
jgi:S1-C subfamily serine protease